MIKGINKAQRNNMMQLDTFKGNNMYSNKNINLSSKRNESSMSRHHHHHGHNRKENFAKVFNFVLSQICIKYYNFPY